MNQKTIKHFCELVNAGIIREELRKQASLNIRCKPINGHVFWQDIVSCRGWVIQQRVGPIHGPYDHYRILDPDGVRQAWGSLESISKQINGCKQSSPSSDEQVYTEFRRLVDAGEIEERLTYQASTNIEWGTMGGHVWWDSLCSRKGWKIQQHKIFKNCRVLSPDDTRYAWGCKSYVFRRIMGQPINHVVGYLNIPRTVEQHFMNYPAQESPSSGIVVLIHGWGCRAKHMEWLAQSLNTFGYDALCYDYSSSRFSISELADELLDCLAELVKANRGKNIYLLSHSMGGLLIRKMLELDRNDRVSSAISRIVMLGPPNQGSLMADLATLGGVGLVNKSIKDMRLSSEAEVHHIGLPAHYSDKIGIIAGTWDFKVIPQNSIEIPGMMEGTDYEITKVSTSHPGLKSSYEALSNAVHYFQHGSFPR